MRWTPKKQYGWHPWFAWRPVDVGADKVWMSWVERKYDHDGAAWRYRKE